MNPPDHQETALAQRVAAATTAAVIVMCAAAGATLYLRATHGPVGMLPLFALLPAALVIVCVHRAEATMWLIAAALVTMTCEVLVGPTAAALEVNLSQATVAATHALLEVSVGLAVAGVVSYGAWEYAETADNQFTRWLYRMTPDHG